MVESILYSVLHRWECWSYWDVPERKKTVLLLWQVLCNRNICTDTCENYKTENNWMHKIIIAKKCIEYKKMLNKVNKRPAFVNLHTLYANINLIIIKIVITIYILL